MINQYPALVNRKIVIAGGTGFVGQALIRYFGKYNEIIVLTRSAGGRKGKPVSANNRNSQAADRLDDGARYVQWSAGTNSADTAWYEALEEADLLINLTGKTVNCRYTETNKREILESRTRSTAALGVAIEQCSKPPALWINASSATYYRDAYDHPQDEYTGESGQGFSVEVCRRWEERFFAANTPLTRKVALRMAIVLGDGGILIPYFRLIRFGLGGRQGSGKQHFSWLHEQDLIAIIEWIAAHPELEGAINAASPNPVINEEFMGELRKATGHDFGLPAYDWMLKLGAAFIGTETELVLKSRWVIPGRLAKSGFSFRFPYLEDAFREILKTVPVKQYSWVKR